MSNELRTRETSDPKGAMLKMGWARRKYPSLHSAMADGISTRSLIVEETGVGMEGLQLKGSMDSFGKVGVLRGIVSSAGGLVSANRFMGIERQTVTQVCIIL